MSLAALLKRLRRAATIDVNLPLVVAGPGGLYDVVDVRVTAGTVVLEIVRQERARMRGGG